MTSDFELIFLNGLLNANQVVIYDALSGIIYTNSIYKVG